MSANHLSELQKQLEQTTQTEQQVNILSQIITLLDNQYADPQQHKEYIDQAYTLALQLDDANLLIHIEILLADWFFHQQGAYADALQHAKNAHRKLKKEHNPALRFKIINRLHTIYLMMSDYESAIETYHDYLRLEGDVTIENRVAIYSNISAAYMQMEAWQQARQHAHKALDELAYPRTPADHQSNRTIINLLENLSFIHHQENNTSQALHFAQQALEFTHQHELPALNTTLVMLARAHNQMGNHQHALQLAHQARQTPDGMRGDFWEAIWHQTLGEILLNDFHQQPIAQSHFEQAEKFYQKINFPFVTQIYTTLYHFYKQKGDFHNALIYHEKYHATTEKIAHQRTSARLMTAQLNYDLEKAHLAHQLEVERANNLQKEVEERRHKEKQLIQSEERYKLLAQLLADYAVSSYIMPDNTLKAEWVIGDFEAITGYTPEEFQQSLNTSTIQNNIHPDDAQRMLQDIQKTIQGERTADDYRIINKSGQTVWLHIARQPIWSDEEGRFVRFYSAARDITRQKQAEESAFALALEREKIQLTTDFIAQTSHDFRTPLSVIGIASQLIRRVDNPERRLIQLDKIDAQIAHLDRLMSALHMLITIHNDLTLDIQPIDANQLLQSVITVEQSQLNGESITLETRLNPALPAIQGDLHFLSLAISAVFSNAIAYTYEGKIIASSTYDDAKITLTIQDTGIGISPEDLPKVFDSFYKANKARTRGNLDVGPGIGLTMARKIIQAHQGDILITSQLNQGTTVTIQLPMNQTAPTQPSSADNPHHSPAAKS